MAPSGPFSNGGDSTVWRAGGFFVGILGRVSGVSYLRWLTSLPPSGAYWVAAFLFGAILPSLVALMVVLPLKGRPMCGG